MGVQGFKHTGLGRGRGHQASGLVSGLGAVVHPAHLLPQVGVLVHIGIDPGPDQGLAESGFMQTGGAGGHHHPVHQAAFEILDDHFLAGIGAHEHIGPGHHHPRHLAGLLANFFHVHFVGNITAAIANVDPHFACRSGFGVLFSAISLSPQMALSFQPST